MKDLLTPDKLVGYGLMVITLAYYSFVVVRKHKSLWQAIIGEDKKLQVPEIVTLIALITLPVMLLADIFLNAKASTEAWVSIDTILFGGLAGTGYKDFLNKRYPKDEK